MINDPIEEYRKKNKDGYNSRNNGDNGFVQSSRGTGDQIGSISENTRRYPRGFSVDEAGTGNGDRGTETQPGRARQRVRRFEHDNSGASEGSDQASGPIGITRAEGPVDIKRGRGRPRKILSAAERVKDEVKEIFNTSGRQLSQKEIDEYKESLPPLIQDYGGYFDRLIGWRYQIADFEMWGNFTDEEAILLTIVLLKAGSRSKYAASFVRKLINGKDYINLGAILVPRFIGTMISIRRVKPQKRNDGLEWKSK